MSSYQSLTQNLLQLPGSPTVLYPTANLTTWINIARGRLAGEGECVRYRATIPTVIGQRPYNFSSINTGVPATNGIQGVIHVRSVFYNLGTGQRWIAPRAWPWFEFYYLNNTAPVNGPPHDWSQYGQGSSGTGTGSGDSGSFYLDPPPDAVYTLNCDCVCYPIALVDDTTVEAIPYPWTDAVPFYAAYYALLSSQTSARQADAVRILSIYHTYVDEARKYANPSVLRGIYEQSGDPVQANKIGISKSATGA